MTDEERQRVNEDYKKWGLALEKAENHRDYWKWAAVIIFLFSAFVILELRGCFPPADPGATLDYYG
jgi:hypothetical protein